MEVILVTGPPRSGTSLTASIIEACGAFGGACYPGSNSNPEGFRENVRIKNEVLKPLLVNHGIDPMGQNPLGDVPQCQKLAKELFSNIIDCWIDDGWDEKSPVYFKDAKLLLCWRLWAQAFPEAKWVITERDPKQIARSCMLAPFMRAYTSVDEWQIFAKAYRNRADELSKTVSAHRVNPRTCEDFRPLVTAIGLKWNDAAANIPRQIFWHY